MKENSPIRVAMVEDTEIIREAVTLFIEHTEGFVNAGVWSSPKKAIEELPQADPDIILMDIGMPEMNGIECIRALRGKVPQAQFLIFTVFEDDANIFEALKAGATGYILKSTPPTDILSSIRELHEGGSPMSASIARKVIAHFRVPESREPESEFPLTDREREILTYLSKGYRYKEISDTLSISFTTVRTHIHNIYEKLQVQSRTDAVNKVFPRRNFMFFG